MTNLRFFDLSIQKTTLNTADFIFSKILKLFISLEKPLDILNTLIKLSEPPVDKKDSLLS